MRPHDSIVSQPPFVDVATGRRFRPGLTILDRTADEETVRGGSFDEHPMPGLDSEAMDFRAASESFAAIRALDRRARWRRASFPPDGIHTRVHSREYWIVVRLPHPIDCLVTTQTTREQQ
jgi:hypothetical protein